VEYDNTKFEIKLDISDYNAEDLNVKIAGDRLVVSGKHQEKQDKYGSISREFTRQFVIPEVSWC
jgi:HSP20 family molecular chaperone IbpA